MKLPIDPAASGTHPAFRDAQPHLSVDRENLNRCAEKDMSQTIPRGALQRATASCRVAANESSRVHDGSPRNLGAKVRARMRQGIVFMAVALSGLFTSGCYDTPRPACGFACSSSGACPSGYVCGAGNRCRLPSVPDSRCVEDLPAEADAMPIDARPDAAIDAMPIDAGTDAALAR